jgi:hypothetical protein
LCGIASANCSIDVRSSSENTPSAQAARLAATVKMSMKAVGAADLKDSGGQLLGQLARQLE